MHRRAFVLGGSALGLAACSGPASVYASDERVRAAAFSSSGPKSLTLYTMRNVESDNGAHTGLLIDASQRVMFDPAGSFGHETIPERDDVHFGFSAQVEAFYASYHARETFYVISQKVVVTPEVAEIALGLALSNGPVSQAMCTRSTSSILNRLPGFESIGVTFFPNTLSNDFARLPGLETRVFRENDADDKSIAAAQIDAQIRAGLSQ